jgi:hypothetical protein
VEGRPLRFGERVEEGMRCVDRELVGEREQVLVAGDERSLKREAVEKITVVAGLEGACG